VARFGDQGDGAFTQRGVVEQQPVRSEDRGALGLARRAQGGLVGRNRRVGFGKGAHEAGPFGRGVGEGSQVVGPGKIEDHGARRYPRRGSKAGEASRGHRRGSFPSDMKIGRSREGLGGRSPPKKKRLFVPLRVWRSRVKI